MLKNKHLDEAREAQALFIREWGLDQLVGIPANELSDIFIDSLITARVDNKTDTT